MKGIFKELVLVGVLSLSSNSFAANNVSSNYVNDTVNSMSRYISPCISWTYNTNGGGYVCSFYDSNVEVIDASEVRRFAREVEQKMRSLETRISNLENK